MTDAMQAHGQPIRKRLGISMLLCKTANWELDWGVYSERQYLRDRIQPSIHELLLLPFRLGLQQALSKHCAHLWQQP